MPFDPDAFLAGDTAVAEPPSTGFDPDAFLASETPAFDPDAFLAESAPPPEAAQAASFMERQRADVLPGIPQLPAELTAPQTTYGQPQVVEGYEDKTAARQTEAFGAPLGAVEGVTAALGAGIAKAPSAMRGLFDYTGYQFYKMIDPIIGTNYARDLYAPRLEAIGRDLTEGGKFAELAGGIPGEIAYNVGQQLPMLPLQLATGGAASAASATAQAGMRNALTASAVFGGLQSASQSFSSNVAARVANGEDLQTASDAEMIPSITSGLITGAITKGFGATGVESIFRTGGLKEAGNKLFTALKQGGFEVAEEVSDEALQIGNDLINSKKVTPEEALKRVGMAAAAASILGTGVAGVHQSMQALSERPSTGTEPSGEIQDRSWRGGKPQMPEPSGEPITAAQFFTRQEAADAAALAEARAAAKPASVPEIVASIEQETAALAAELDKPTSTTTEAAPTTPAPAPIQPKSSGQEQVPLAESAKVETETQPQPTVKESLPVAPERTTDGGRLLSPEAVAKMPDNELADRLGAMRTFLEEKKSTGAEIIPSAVENARTLFTEAEKRGLIEPQPTDKPALPVAEEAARARPPRPQGQRGALHDEIYRREENGEPAIYIDNQLITPRGKYEIGENGKYKLVQELSKNGFERNLMSIEGAKPGDEWFGMNEHARARQAEIIAEREAANAAETAKRIAKDEAERATISRANAYREEIKATPLPPGKKGKITLASEAGEKQQVDATIHGNFAIRKVQITPRVPAKYSITHIPSGKKVLDADSLSNAKDYIKAIIHSGAKMDLAETPPAELVKAGEAVKFMRDGGEPPKRTPSPTTEPEKPASPVEAPKPTPALTASAVAEQSTRIEAIVDEAVNAGRDRIEAEAEANRVVDGAREAGEPVNWALVKTAALGKPTQKRGGGRTSSLDEPISSDTETTKAETLPAPKAEAPVEDAVVTAMNSAIDKTLSPRDAAIVRAVQERSMEEVGAEHGITKQAVSKIVKEALPKVRAQMEKDGFGPEDYQGGPGAMGPVEALEQKANETTTGLKRATVDTERLARGAEPIPTPERQREEGVVQAAEDKVDADPTAAPALVARIVDKGDKAISEQEAAILLVERQRVMNERKAWEERKALGEDVKEADAKLEELETQLERLDQAQRAAGTTWGRLGHMYQRMIREDFTLEAMERKERAAKQRPLTPDELSKIKEQAAEIERLQKEIETAKTAETEAAVDTEVERTYEATINELGKDYLEKPSYGKEVFDIAHGIVNRWKTEAEAAHKSLRERLGRTSAGVDPTIVLDVAKILRAKIGEFGLKRAEAAAELISEYGPKVRPYLNSAWEKAQQMIAAEKTTPKVREVVKRGTKKKGEATPETIKAKAKAEAVAGEELSHKTVYEYVRALINSGVHGEAAVMKAAHQGLSEFFPDATERDIRRAYSEYGKVKFPSKEATAVEMRELRTLVRLQESIDRMTENRDALHTGLQRDKATLAIREKQKQLNELLKKRQGPPSPEKLASREEAKITALRNQIEELDKQLRTGESPPKGAPLPDSAAVEQLKAERDAMKEKLREIEEAANPPKTEAEKQVEALQKIRDRLDETLAGKRDPNQPQDFNPLSAAAEDLKAEIIAMQELAAQMRRDAKPPTDVDARAEAQKIKTLEDAIARYEDKIARGDFTTQGAKLGPDSAKVAALKAIRDARIDAYNAAKKAGMPVKTPEEIYNAARMKAVTKQLAEVEAKIAAGKFERPPKRVPKKKEQAVIDKELELAEAKKKFNKGLFEAEQARRSLAQKIWDGIQQTKGASVNIVSSMDFSAPRQALVSILANTTRLITNPVRGAKMLGKPAIEMFKAWGSEKTAREIEYKLNNRPNAKSGAEKIAGVEHTSLDAQTFTKAEETARSVLDEWAQLPMKTGNLAKTIATAPAKIGAKAVRMSNRAFITFLNSTRAELFDEMLRSNFKDRAPTDAELKVIGNMVNIATGRGKMNPAHAKFASEVLWAPKLLASRIQFLTGQPLWTGKFADTGRARAIVAKEYARVIVGGFILAAVARMFDEKREDESTSSDFGKIVRGNTRIDPWGGFQQVTVLAERIRQGKTTSISGKETDQDADRKFGAPGMYMVTTRFLRSKLRPDIAAMADMIDRQNIVGEKTTAKMVAQGLLIPLPMREIKSLIQDRGVPEALALQLLNEFGAGVSVYEKKADKEKPEKAKEAARP